METGNSVTFDGSGGTGGRGRRLESRRRFAEGFVGAVVTGGMTMLRPPCRCAIQSYDGQSSVLYQIIACKAVPRPSRKKVDRLCSAINELTTRRKAWRDVEELISRINRKLRGWSNYFRIGTVSKAYRNINSHTRYRVRQWLCAKFQEQGQGKKRFSNQYLHQKLGLHQP